MSEFPTSLPPQPLYIDPDTGEAVFDPSEEDSPEANARRAERHRLSREYSKGRYERRLPSPYPNSQIFGNETVTRAESPAAPWSEAEKDARCDVGPEDAPASVGEASPELKIINTSLPEK